MELELDRDVISIAEDIQNAVDMTAKQSYRRGYNDAIQDALNVIEEAGNTKTAWNKIAVLIGIKKEIK